MLPQTCPFERKFVVPRLILQMGNQCTKLEVVRFSHSIGHVTTPFHGKFVICKLGLITVNLFTKFDVSTFTHYKDTKANRKCRNCGGFGKLKVTQGQWQHNHWIQRIYDFLFDFNKNYACILYSF